MTIIRYACFAASGWLISEVLSRYLTQLERLVAMAIALCLIAALWCMMSDQKHPAERGP